MHAILERSSSSAQGSAFFKASFPDTANDDAIIVAPAVERFAYGERRRPNWAAFAAIAGFHVAAFALLVKLDVISISPPAPKALVVQLIPLPVMAEPPAPKPRQLVSKAPVTPQIVVPQVVVTQNIAPPVQMAITTTPKPPVVEAPAPAPALVVPPNSNAAGLHNDAPHYPTESRRLREQGTVVLAVNVTEDGRVASIHVSSTSGFERLDKEALNTVRRWKFRPATQGGQPVPAVGYVDIPFVLKG